MGNLDIIAAEEMTMQALKTNKLRILADKYNLKNSCDYFKLINERWQQGKKNDTIAKFLQLPKSEQIYFLENWCNCEILNSILINIIF